MTSSTQIRYFGCISTPKYYLAELTLKSSFAIQSVSYKHLQHQVTGLASVVLNLQSSHAYGGVVSDPIEGARLYERPLLVLRNAAGEQIAHC